MKNKSPVIFVGHGSPMNIIAQNNFTNALKSLGKKITKPKAIIVLSAHWQTNNATVIHSSSNPQTIYDFYGFPEPLYKIEYSAKGAYPILVQEMGADWFKSADIKPELTWGLDHGAWSVLHHLFPDRDIPVTQISLNNSLTYEQHYNLAHKISELRHADVLILASGNVVHNLRAISWNEIAPIQDWAQNFHDFVKEQLKNKNFNSLINFPTKEKQLFKLSHPTNDHYLPLIYAIGAANPDDHINIIYDEIQNSSISMLSFILE